MAKFLKLTASATPSGNRMTANMTKSTEKKSKKQKQKSSLDINNFKNTVLSEKI